MSALDFKLNYLPILDTTKETLLFKYTLFIIKLSSIKWKFRY